MRTTFSPSSLPSEHATPVNGSPSRVRRPDSQGWSSRSLQGTTITSRLLLPAVRRASAPVLVGRVPKRLGEALRLHQRAVHRMALLDVLEVPRRLRVGFE